MCGLLSVVIDVVDFKGVGLAETKNHTPVCANGYCPEALEFALQWMQSKARQIHVRYCDGRIETSKNVPELLDMLGKGAARIVILIQRFSPLWRNDWTTLYRNALRNGCQG
jgi:hypothetical protein